MMWSTLIRTRLGTMVMRSRQHYWTVPTLPLPLWPQREPRESGGITLAQPRSGVMVMRPRQRRYLMVSSALIQPRLIRPGVVAMTPRQRYGPC